MFRCFLKCKITEKDFVPLGFLKRLKLNNKDYAVHMKKLREYNIINNIPLKGIGLRRKFFPLVHFGVKVARLLNKHTLEIIGDKRIATERPCILAVTHVGKFDIERVFEACNTSCWIFNGDPETVYRNFDGFSLFTSGVIHIDTESKTDRRVATETAIKLLKSGGNLMFFPEGIWNVEPSIPVLPLYGGIVDIAFRSNADIIPVAIEQYGNHFQINIGQNIKAEDLQRISDSKCEVLSFLRDELAKLKWEIFENNPDNRLNIKDANEIHQKRVESRLNEWVDKNGKPYYNEEILKIRQYKPKNMINYPDVFSHLKTIKPNLLNAFLLNARLV